EKSRAIKAGTRLICVTQDSAHIASNYLKKQKPGTRILIVVDECHTLEKNHVAETYTEKNASVLGMRAILNHPDYHILGVSATPRFYPQSEEDEFEDISFDKIFGKVVSTYTYEQAVSDGVILPADIYFMAESESPIPDLKLLSRALSGQFLLTRGGKHNDWAWKTAYAILKMMMEKGKTHSLVFLKSVEKIKMVQERCRFLL